ncbi:hypothetical protein [Catellatospora sp. NPDC049609]|uniref:hypothetical protein n=1 Tax=Catellatospora sp. NPDC049609 TaxID=3155505 RepID=UPI00342D9461
MRRDAVGRWQMHLAGGGFSVTAPLSATGLEDAIRCAEDVLAATRRQVPVMPWQQLGLEASTRLGRAEHQAVWSRALWRVEVCCDREGRWWLRRTLADHLAPIRDAIGDRGTGLVRALRVAAAILAEQRWATSAPWTIAGSTATTTARRPPG